MKQTHTGDNQKTKFFCCVNVWISEADELDQWLQNLADDPAFLQQNLYIYLLDTDATVKTKAACSAFYARFPNNVSVLHMPQKSYMECYNMAAAKAVHCEYVNYTDTSVVLHASDIRKMKDKIQKKTLQIEVPLWSFYPISVQADGSLKPYLSFAAKDYHQSNSNFRRFSIFLPGFLIRSDISLGFRFDEKAPDDADILFLISTIFEGKDYMLTDIPLVCHEPFENDYYNYRRQFNPGWYTDTLLEVYLPYLKKHSKSGFVKTLMTYFIQIRFACNRNDRSKNILLGEDLDQFFEAVKTVLSLIDDNILVTYNINGMKMMPKYIGMVLLRLKYDNENLYPRIATDNTDNYVGIVKNALVDTRKSLKAVITCMDYDTRKKELVIDGKLSNVFIFRYHKIQCLAFCGSVVKPAKRTEIYTLEKYFGISMYRDYTFQVRFSARELKSASAGIFFQFRYGNIKCLMDIVFNRMQSRLVNQFPHSYWAFSKYVMTYDAKKKALILNPRSMGFLLKQELKLYSDFCRYTPKSERPRAWKSILMRQAYWWTRPFFRKRQIWLTFDQMFKGGDNGEYFFRYTSDHHAKDVDIYYVANKDCADYQRLKQRYKHLLPFNSWKEKLITLHTKYVFATRVDVKQYCGYGPQLEKYFRGLLNYEVFCLQHGLTIQRIAQYQNRLFDDTKLYFCVSPNEVQNLSHPVYGYDPRALVLTGAPRYDGLINDDKKQILISPTWRRNVTAGTNKKGKQHEYSINFKETEYYRIYNSLINNERLIACARETGYRIIYLLHPILSPQVQDFHAPEEVSIIAGASGDVSYERMMCESSLMLTDHSGIQFDFASMRKPLVYYHPNTLPPQYDEGGMDYETQAFGPVCRTEDEVVDALCRSMRNNCRMEDKYRARADSFFAYDDHNNCERIYNAAMKYCKKGL